MNSKKQIEWIVADYFRKIYAEFPKGRLIASESPDFIIATSPRAETGMELTRFVPPENGHAGSFMKNNLEGSRFLNAIREAFDPAIYPFLWVKMLFSGDSGPEEKRWLSGVSMTTAAIRRNLLSAGGDDFAVSISSRELPSFLSGIWIAGSANSGEHLWELAYLPAQGFEVVEGLKQTIRRKEDKLPGYRTVKTREIWLLITIDTFLSQAGNQVENSIRNTVFHSAFDRVFVFGLMNARIIRIV